VSGLSVAVTGGVDRAKLERAAADAKLRLDELWTSPNRSWHFVELAADELAVAAGRLNEFG
jgi:hypothetical protein